MVVEEEAEEARMVVVVAGRWLVTWRVAARDWTAAYA